MGASTALLAAQAGDRSMKEDMEIQAKITKDPALGSLPSLQFDGIKADVPVDDRIKADEAFKRPLAESLQEGMAWYLEQRGLGIVPQNGDLRVVGIIESYEGFKGWGHWGVDLHLRVKFFRGPQLVFSESLRSFLKYKDDGAVEKEEQPKYDALKATVDFPEILFTRIGVDLSEKLITLLQEKSGAVPAAPQQAGQSESEARGRLTVDSTVPHAEVLIDGKLVGTTPVEDLLLSASVHAVEVRKQGFKPWKREVTILSGAASRITAELEAEGSK